MYIIYITIQRKQRIIEIRVFRGQFDGLQLRLLKKLSERSEYSCFVATFDVRLSHMRVITIGRGNSLVGTMGDRNNSHVNGAFKWRMVCSSWAN